ncbi:hypothetical protein [Streptomyces sp. NPDC057554]|uniref:hypothetical protein n=1 Tax=Streptomyces sp. NPDC057554 TaxID=3350538 RepID=UPI0036AF67F1
MTHASPATPDTSPASVRWEARDALLPGATGIVLVVIALFLAAGLPGKFAEVREFRAALPCAGAVGPAAGHGDCLSERPATVLAKERRKQSKSEIWLVKVDPGAGASPVQVRMQGPGPVFDEVERGDRVVLHSWRSTVWAVGLGDLRQDAHGKPGDIAFAQLGVTLALAILGAALLLAALRRALRRPRDPVVRAWRAAVPCVAALVAAGVAITASVVADDAPLVLLVSAAGCAVSGAAAALLTWLLGRRATDDVVLEPTALTGRQVVRATVVGDVPYSVEGYDHLVLDPPLEPGGRARLAPAPDAYGKAVLDPLPDTLVPLRLRRKHVADPRPGRWWSDVVLRWYSEVVLECRDGEVPVLVVAERHDMRRILGALPPPAG